MSIRFTLLALSDADLADARSLLPGVDLEQNGDYLSGRADEPAIERLLAAGHLLNVEPDEEPPDPEAPTFSVEALFDEGGASLESAEDLPVARTVRLLAPLTDERRQALAEMGVRLGRKLGRGSYVAQVDPLRLPDATAAWMEVGGYGLKATLGDELAGRIQPDGARLKGADDDDFNLLDAGAAPMEPRAPGAIVTGRGSAERLPYDVSCHDRANLGRVADWLAMQPAVLQVETGEDRLRLWVDEGPAEQALLGALGLMEEVATVESYVPPEPQLSFAVQAVLGAGRVIADLPWRGKGQVIGVADSGVDADHPDLKGRVQVVLRVAPLSARDPAATAPTWRPSPRATGPPAPAS